MFCIFINFIVKCNFEKIYIVILKRLIMIDINIRFSLMFFLEDGRFWRLIEYVGSYMYMVLILKKKENF